MPKPTIEQLQTLGPAVLPFERTQFSRQVLYGEDILFENDLYNATEDGLPASVIKTDPKRIIDERPFGSKYLWVIMAEGLFLIKEATGNIYSDRGVVYHTNITGGEEALQGGELWFGTDDTVYINNQSGRYGAQTIAQRQAVIDYFNFVGYKNVIQLKPIGL